MKCDDEGHRFDPVAGRCRACGLDEDEIVLRRQKRELRNARAAAKPVPVKLKGVAGFR